MKEHAYNVDRDKDHKSLMTKSISLISQRSVTMNSIWSEVIYWLSTVSDNVKRWSEHSDVDDDRTFQMGTIKDTIDEGTEGDQQLGYKKNDTLINHYTKAKDISDNVKMLLEGSELMKEDRESQLYDDFEHFCQNKGETIHDYYVWFAKLINDMRNIKMTMSRMQLNSKFVNNMLPEWVDIVATVKLNRGL
ncbi:hypothetical protein Tco_0156794 [Tanacetum coccineum]